MTCPPNKNPNHDGLGDVSASTLAGLDAYIKDAISSTSNSPRWSALTARRQLNGTPAQQPLAISTRFRPG